MARWGQVLVVLTLLVLPQWAIVSADAPAQQEAPVAQASVTPTAVPTTPEDTVPTATAQPPVERDSDAEQQATPTPTPSSPLPGTAHLAVQVGESVVAVGGTASSEVFVSLTDVQPGISGFSLNLRFDPKVVQVVDADGIAGNGTQVETVTFFVGPQVGPQTVTENRVDNVAGEIWLTVMQEGDTPVHDTPSWYKVATLVWTGSREGNSVVSVGSASYFVGPGGQRFELDAARNGTVFVRKPAQIQGTVWLQGRETSDGAQVACELSAARVDTVGARPDGRFVLTTSHGEGFYTVRASAPGYLSAEGDRPVKLTVGSSVDLGEVVLYGGDATGDDRVDIRDLSYVAWQFDGDDAKADINGDGQVDILDLSLIAGNFGRVGPTSWELPAMGGQ
jgi:hypothetical protein